MLVFHFLRREGCLGEGDERIRIVHGDIGVTAANPGGMWEGRLVAGMGGLRHSHPRPPSSLLAASKRWKSIKHNMVRVGLQHSLLCPRYLGRIQCAVAGI